jgi:hypothetical protein
VGGLRGERDRNDSGEKSPSEPFGMLFGLIEKQREPTKYIG